jgi:hypothetical protein
VTALRPSWPAPGALDRRQREFELAKALDEARALQARLEMLGDHQTTVHIVQAIRHGLAAEIAALPGADRVPIAPKISGCICQACADRGIECDRVALSGDDECFDCQRGRHG